MTAELQQTSISREEYFASPGLSNTGIKDLMISPLRFWWNHVRPDREPIEPTAEMVFGSALHCAVLEPDRFETRYGCEFVPAVFPDALDTIADIRQWCKDKGSPARGTLKQEVIAHALSIDGNVEILQVLEERHNTLNAGKILLPADNWLLVAGASTALWDEPRVKEILKHGRAEVPYLSFENGVPIKGMLDWVHPNLILDLKTFTQQRGKAINKTIADAIFYEGYYRQAYLYAKLRRFVDGDQWRVKTGGEFVLAFVESLPPHETRIKVLQPKRGGNPNLYWGRARVEVEGAIRTYREYMAAFGVDKPWKYAQEIDPLQDEEIPALTYAA